MESKALKILAIDDIKDNLIILKALIHETFPKSAVLTATNGKNGLELAAEEDPDVILLDIIMPEMDGFEVCKKLKSDKKLFDIPVVFVTALKGDKESRIKALESGAEAFLTKPIDEIELTVQIRAMVKIKEANLRKRNEKEYLEKLVAERTLELEQSRIATLNLLDGLKAEIEVRENMEKELTASKLYLNNIINSVASPIFVKDCEYKFLLVNNALCTLLNQPAEKLIGSTGFEHFPDDQNDVFLAKDKEVFMTGKENINEEFLTDGTGNIRTIVTRKTLYVDQAGNKFLVGVINDITERKKTEIALVKSEEKFRNLITQMRSGLAVHEIILDEKGMPVNYRFLDVNPSFERLTGLKRENIIGKTILEILPETEKIWIEKYGRVALTGESVSFENYASQLDRFYSVVAYQPREKQFAVVIEDVTDRKKAEEKLKDNLALLRIAGEVTKLGGWNVNLEENRSYWSDEVAAIHEMPAGFAPLLEEGIRFYAPEWREKITQVFTDCAKKGIPYNERMEIITSTGKRVWIKTIGEAVRNKNGEIFKVHGAFQDISDQVKSEESIRESEKKYRLIAENMGNVVAMLDMDLNYIYVSPNIEKTVGFSVDEYLKMKMNQIMTPESFQLVMEAFEEEMALEMKGTANPHRSRILELEEYRKDGSIVLNENTVSFIRDKDGQPVSILSVSRDITEKKKAEEELIKSRKDFQNYFEMGSIGMCVTSPDKKWVEVNDCLCRMLGYTKEELSRIKWDDLTHPDDIGTNLQLFNQVMDGKRDSYEIDKRFIRKDGSIIYTTVNLFCRRNEDGTANYFISSILDITDKLKIQDMIQHTAKLDSLGILAGGIAHDFNNLLGGIFGYIEMAKDKSTEPKVSEYLTKALSSMDRTLGLTNQLLTFAKGGVPVRKADLLFPFLKETAQFALSGSNVSCVFDYPDDLWVCNFDRNQIGQVIDNLIINAQQAMPVGGTIKFTARNIFISENEHPSLAQGRYVKLSVKDQGIGISKELLTRIFDPFFTTKAKGHGLGLATCYSITKQHDGCIDVESELGKGTTFYVYIPASTESVISSTENSNHEHKGSGTILVMDDEEIIRDLVRTILESLGYNAVCKTNGKEAIDFFLAEIKAGRKIAGMIFDITVPGSMGGIEAITEIRKLDTQIPIFVASGYSDDPVMADPSKYGFTASISKPFKITDLSKMLNTYLK